MSSLRPRGLPTIGQRPAPRRSGRRRVVARGSTAPPPVGLGRRDTALPNALHLALERRPWGSSRPVRVGHLVHRRRRLPDGRTSARRRCASPADRAATLAGARSRRRRRRVDSLAWLGAVAAAAATVAAGLVTPCVRTDRDLPVARWVPLDDAVLTPRSTRWRRRCRRSACPRRPTRRPSPTSTPSMVDGSPATAWPTHGWRADLPTAAPRPRSAARAVFRALATRSADQRQRRRPPRRGRRAGAPASSATTGGLRGEPVVVPRVRLVVPDDPYDDWEVRLELVDELDPGRWCTAEDVWDATPLAVELAGGRRPRRPRWPSVVGGSPRRWPGASTSPPTWPRAHEPAALELDVEDGRALPRAGAGRARSRCGIELIGPERLVRAGVARARPGHAERRRPTSRRGSAARPSSTGAWSSPTTTARRPSPTPSWRGPSAPARRCCTPAGAGCASTRRRCAGPGDGWRTTSATTRGSTPSRCCAWPATASSRSTRPTAGAAPAWTAELLAGLPDERLPRSHEPAGVRRRAAPVPAARPRLAAVPRAPRPRRVPRRRHGPRQDRHHAGPPARPARPAPRRVPAVGRPQLGGRGGPLHAVAARRRPPRRRAAGATRPAADATRSPAPTSSSRRTGCCRATSSTSAPSPGRRSSPTRPRRSRTPATRPPRRSACCAPGRSWPSPARRWRTAWPTCGRSSTPSTPGCSAAASGSATASPSPSSATATATPRPGCGASPSRSCCAARKADRTLVPDLPDKIEQVAWAGLTREQAVLYQHVVDQLLADAAATTGMKRRGPGARRADPAQADLQPPGPRARRRLAARRALRQAGPLRRAGRRAARRRRAGARVHPVPRDGRAAACATLAERLELRRAVPARRRGQGPARRDGRRLPGRPRAAAAARLAEGRRHRPQPHGGQPGHPLRPVVEPGRRGPGHRPGVAHRPEPHGRSSTSWSARARSRSASPS